VSLHEIVMLCVIGVSLISLVYWVGRFIPHAPARTLRYPESRGERARLDVEFRDLVISAMLSGVLNPHNRQIGKVEIRDRGILGKPQPRILVEEYKEYQYYSEYILHNPQGPDLMSHVRELVMHHEAVQEEERRKMALEDELDSTVYTSTQELEADMGRLARLKKAIRLTRSTT